MIYSITQKKKKHFLFKKHLWPIFLKFWINTSSLTDFNEPLKEFQWTADSVIVAQVSTIPTNACLRQFIIFQVLYLDFEENKDCTLALRTRAKV